MTQKRMDIWQIWSMIHNGKRGESFRFFTVHEHCPREYSKNPAKERAGFLCKKG